MRRRLSTLEIQEAQLVFASSLDYKQIWIHEEMKFPNWVAKIGSAIAGQKPPANNAITIGVHIFFPVKLQIDHQAIENLQLKDIGWLMHELTHAWQFQQIGIRYLFQAILGHMRFGSAVYDFGGEKGLADAVREGKGFATFNPEQQGDIIRKFYVALKHEDVSASLTALVEQVKNPGRFLRG